MQITVKLVGAFRIGRFKEQLCQYPAASTAHDVAIDLQLPEQILGIALINGNHAEFDARLHDGDHLTLMPILDGG